MTEPEQPARPAEPADDEALRQRWREASVLERETAARAAAERASVELEVWKARQHAELASYTADQEALSDERRAQLAYAARLALSDLVPGSFRGGAKRGDALNERQLRQAASSIVMAWNVGKALGYPEELALQHLYAVDGNIRLRSESARGRLFAAGWDIDDKTTYDGRTGYPIAHTVTLTRPGKAPKTATYRLEQALRGGMISAIATDDAGAVTGVKSRSTIGKPMPWETATESMLLWAATRDAIKRYASDVVSGLDIASPYDGGEALVAPPLPPRSSTVTATVERVTGQRMDEAESYDPAADLALIEQATGRADPPPWWEHADAPARLGVKRRTKVQLAADRISAWIQEHPEEAEGISPPGLTRVDEGDGSAVWHWDADVVEAEIEGDEGAGPSETDEKTWGVSFPDATPVEPLAESPAEFEPNPVTPYREMVDYDEVLPEAGLPEPEFEPTGTEHAAADRDAPTGPSAADLLAVLNRLAEGEGKSLGQYLRREIALKRRNPTEWTVEELVQVVKARSGATDEDLGIRT